MRWLLVCALAAGVAAAGDADAPQTAPVHLDVSVRDARGRAPDKLSAADFTVTVGGAALPVLSAQFVGQATAGAGRVVAFFLDEYHVDAESAARARDLLARFIRDELGPDDQLIVLRPLDSLLTLQLTSDRNPALKAVAAFEGRRGDYAPRTPLEREVVAGAPARADDVRAQIVVSALHALATHLAQLPAARKALVVVSDGFAPRATRRAGTVLPTIDAVVREANRANVSIYPMSAAPVSDRADANAAVLHRLADETAGRIIEPVADGLHRLVADMSGYYLLEVSSTADGRFHQVDVQASRPGLTVRTRPGFWAISAEELDRARRAAAPVAPPPPALPALHTSRLIRPWIGQSRAGQGLTRLTLIWEAAPSGAGERSRPLPPSRLRIKALGQDGSALFEGVLSSSQGGPAGSATRAVFDVPPGRIRLQMAVEDAAAQPLDTDVRDVMVQALTGPVAFGTPAVFRARTARAFRELTADIGAPPVAGREFSRDERLLIRLPVYGDGLTDVRAALTNRAGHVMRALTVQSTGGADPSIDLPLAGLAAGEYAVVITARGDAHEAQESVPFRVTP